MFFFFFFIEFRKNVLEILSKADINYYTNESIEDIVFGVRNSISYIIKIKEYTTLEVSFNTINDAVEELITTAKIVKEKCELVLIVSCVLDEKIRKQLKVLYPNIIFVDIANLLFAVQKDEELKNNLVSSLSYTIDDIKPSKGQLEFSLLSNNSVTEKLIKEMKLCKAGKLSARKYEEMCHKLLKNVFSNDLTLWKEQQRSNSALYKFDLICRIKEDNKKTFWSIVERFFNSKYIIFEFKNYKEQVTPKEIYTTEKYLYVKALRSVAIMIATNGYIENAKWAAKGIFRESGKLILLLDTNDLIAMNELKVAGGDPSACLLDKLDELLLELEK